MSQFIRSSAVLAVALGGAGCSPPRDRVPVAGQQQVAPTAAAAGVDAASPGVLAHYDLTGKPAWQAKLPKDLEEISGLAFGGDGRLFAEGDQDGTIWQLDARSGKVLKTFRLAPTGHDPDMGKKQKAGVVTGDFEDIQIVGDRFFLISSTGTLLEFREGADGARVPYTAYDTGLGKACEIEGLAHDATTRALLILCKHAQRDDWKDEVVAVGWSLERKATDVAPRFRIPYARTAAVTGDRAFHGSAVAYAPDGGSLVLIAGPQESFVELSPVGAVIAGGQLDHGAHRQPEGIAFAPDGTLLISDEGAGKRATISGYARH